LNQYFNDTIIVRRELDGEINIVVQKGATLAIAHPCLRGISAAGVNSVMRKRKHKL